MELDEYQIKNRTAWQSFAKEYEEPGELAWKTDAPKWGIWGIAEEELGLLPTDLHGKRCLEIGCGTGYVSSWLARRGALAVGIDPTPRQLETARRLEQQHQLGVELVEGFGEELPFPDSSFDFAISEYGAALWADPYRWIPEAARVLKNESRLVFMTNHALAHCCEPDVENPDEPLSKTLQRPYFGLFKQRWEFSSEEVEFHLSHGAWVELLRDNGFTVERLLELGAPKNSESRYGWADPEWAAKWPTEEVWCVFLSKS